MGDMRRIANSDTGHGRLCRHAAGTAGLPHTPGGRSTPVSGPHRLAAGGSGMCQLQTIQAEGRKGEGAATG